MLRQVLRHLSAPSCCQASLSAAAAAVGPQLRADAGHAPVDRELLAHHLRQLERDGVTVLEEVYTREQVAQWQAALDAAWVPLKAELPSLDWRTYRFKQHYLDADSFCTGKVLYEGKRVARRDDGTGVIDMGRGRFDVYGTALETNAALSVIVDEYHRDQHMIIECKESVSVGKHWKTSLNVGALVTLNFPFLLKAGLSGRLPAKQALHVAKTVCHTFPTFATWCVFSLLSPVGRRIASQLVFDLMLNALLKLVMVPC